MPAPAQFKGLARTEALGLVAKAVVKAGARSLALSAAVLGPGFVLLMGGRPALGTAWLFVGSFGMVAWTYRRPWRLGPVSCLIPPVIAAFCYLVQLWLFGDAAPSLLLVLAATGAGAAVGWIRGRSHVVYEESGTIFAQRTILYLGIWAVAYALTQILGMVAANILLVRGGLVTGAFSTAMLAIVSFVLLGERNRLRARER